MSVNIYENGELKQIAGVGTKMFCADSPVGSIVPYGGTVAPTDWFLCQGQELDRTEYADLFAVIGESFGTPSSITKFKLPDLRGEFLRGAGTNSHSGQGDGGTVGQHQDATEFPLTNSRIGSTGIVFETQATENTRGMIAKFDKSGLPLGSASDTLYYTAYEMAKYQSAQNNCMATSRPTNISVNYIIKAKQTVLPADLQADVEQTASDVAAGLVEDVADNRVVKKNVTVTGTADMEADIRALLDEIASLTKASSYAGEFLRYGTSTGSYTLTLRIPESGNKTVIGYVNNADMLFGVTYRYNASTATATYSIKPIEPDYSTGEMNTGKKWIDGKPIYRKVFTNLTSPDNNYETLADISSLHIETLITSKGVLLHSVGKQMAFEGSYVEAISTESYIMLYTSSNDTYFKCGAFNDMANKPLTVIIEYTKTTD